MKKTNEWRIPAKYHLSNGLGVEDISVRLGVPVDDVRQFVSALRKSGRLTSVLFDNQYRGDA